MAFERLNAQITASLPLYKYPCCINATPKKYLDATCSSTRLSLFAKIQASCACSKQEEILPISNSRPAIIVNAINFPSSYPISLER
ncbi:hypothetical protein D3C80_988730 [compost metagenome]